MKKNQKLLEMMNEIDEKYIEEAEKASFLPQKHIWKKMGSIAASLALAAAIGTFPLWGHFDNPEIGPGNKSEIGSEIPTPTSGNAESAEYVWDAEKGIFTLKNSAYGDNGYVTSTDEKTNTLEAIGVFPEVTQEETKGEDVKQTPNVLYPYITGEYADYVITKGRVLDQYIGEKLGAITMRGEDGKTLEAELYAIISVDTKCAVAVKYPKYDYCIFYNPNVKFDTFAEFKAAYSLDTELYMGVIMVEHIVADNSDHLVELKGIAPLKEMILALDGAACTYEEFAENCDMTKSIGVDVEQGALWQYAWHGLQIFEDGYLVTNLGGSIQIFDIGEDAAKAIIADAEENRYNGVNFYDEKRDVLVYDTSSVVVGAPETEATYQGAIETAADDPYRLTTPSYDPHSSAKETTTAAPPYMPETIPEIVPEETTQDSPLYDVNQPSYEGHDPYAWTTEETVVCETDPLIYEGYDPYAWKN